jgi:hypothetical protein
MTSGNKQYDPLYCLEREGNRFLETNTFTPMDVTGFYIQAMCVISEAQRLREENKALRDIICKRQQQIASLEETTTKALIALRDCVSTFDPDKEIRVTAERQETWFREINEVEELLNQNREWKISQP